METVIITDEMLNKEVINKPARFDMAINFYCCVKKDNKYYIVAYYYNPAWDMYYPFYDDKNKIPILNTSRAKNYKQLIDETDQILSINLDEKLKLAHQRFKDLIGSDCKTVSSKLSCIYELKYSKTAKIHTIYKLYNFIITHVDDIVKMLNPTSVKCKLVDLNNLEDANLVSNATHFVSNSKEELKKFAIEI